MLRKVFDLFFGCRHDRYSFPQTIRGQRRRPAAGALTGSYVACLDCGKEFPYDWREMKILTSAKQQRRYWRRREASHGNQRGPAVFMAGDHSHGVLVSDGARGHQG